MMKTQRPEALALANTALQVRNEDTPADVYVALGDCAWALRNLHAENERLRVGYDATRLEIASLQAQLEAIGAGGVSALMPESWRAQPTFDGRIYTTTSGKPAQCLQQSAEPASGRPAAPDGWKLVQIAVEPHEVLVAIKRPDGYEDVHPELVAADALPSTPFEYRVAWPLELEP